MNGLGKIVEVLNPDAFEDEQFVGDEDPLYIAEREVLKLYQDSIFKAIREGKQDEVRQAKKLQVYTEQGDTYNFYMQNRFQAPDSILEDVGRFQKDGPGGVIEYKATRPYWQKEGW